MKKEKIILIDPPNTSARNVRPQLGTLYLAAMLLEKNMEVCLIDFTVQCDAWKILENELNENRIVCVGISAVIGPIIAGGLEVARFVRKINPGIPIVWGGPHPTSDPEGTLKHDLVDAICIGEGEITFPEMIEAYRGNGDLKCVKGIGFKSNHEMIFTSPREEYFDLNTLPKLPYHLLNLEMYKIKPGGYFPPIKKEQILSLETSRGCNFRCRYCIQAVKKEKFHRMSTQKLLSCIDDIVALGVTGISINDDNFFVNKEEAVNTLRAIAEKNYGLEIYVAARSDFLAEADDQVYELMQKAGIKMFGIGVESGSDRILKSLHKGEKVEISLKANRKLAKYGMYAWFNIITGFPEERIVDTIQSHLVMIELLRENPCAVVPLNKLIPIPSTPILEDCVKAGWKPPESLEQWATVIADTRKGRPPYYHEEVYQWYENYFFKGAFTPADLPRLNFISKEYEKEKLKEKEINQNIHNKKLEERISLLSLWLEKKNSHRSLKTYLSEKKLFKIAILGKGVFSRHCIQELQGDKLFSVTVVDNKEDSEKEFMGCPVIRYPEIQNPAIFDLLIITAIHESDHRKITEELESILHFKMNITNIKQIIQEW